MSIVLKNVRFVLGNFKEEKEILIRSKAFKGILGLLFYNID